MHSIDFRNRVLEIKEAEKLSFRTAFQTFQSLYRKSGFQKKIGPIIKRNKPATKINMEALKRDIEQHTDAYQYEQAQRPWGIFAALKRLDATYKKTLKAPPNAKAQKGAAFLPKA